MCIKKQTETKNPPFDPKLQTRMNQTTMWMLVSWAALLVVGIGAQRSAISSVPGYAGDDDPPLVLPLESVELRLRMATSYMATADRFLIVGDNTKALACNAAARAWLNSCFEDGPSPEQGLRCAAAAAQAAINLATLAKAFDPRAMCCHGQEALAWVQGRPLLRNHVWSILEKMGVVPACPSLASGNHFEEHGPRLSQNLGCDLIPLAVNAEEIISTFRLSQGELFESRHPDVPYQNATGRDPAVNGFISHPPLHDLRLEPLRRFSSGQWNYVGNNSELMAMLSINALRRLDEVNITLGAADMFHSCIPSNGKVFGGSGHLMCVWRRHLELFSMTQGIFLARHNWHQRETSPREVPLLRSAGEDPRFFWYRGRPYYSIQQMTSEQGKQWNAQTAEGVFRNFLVDAGTGQVVQLRLPSDDTTEPAYIRRRLKKHQGSSFTPEGKNWTPLVYQGQLLFFFTLLPLRVLHCDPETGTCQWWWPENYDLNSEIETDPGSVGEEQKDVGALRGGSAAVIVPGGDGTESHVAIGFGHATLSSAQHSIFLYAVDMKTLRIRLAFMDPASEATPFAGFSYLDPTSFWTEDSNIEMASGGKVRQRVLVMCTLRAAPDYLSFDPAHHQTLIFEAQSSLLEGILDDSTKEDTVVPVVVQGGSPGAEEVWL